MRFHVLGNYPTTTRTQDSYDDVTTTMLPRLIDRLPLTHTTRHRCNEKVEACDDDAVAGYTDSYEPEALPTLDEAYESQLIVGNDTTHIGSNDSVNCTLYLGSSSVSFEPDDASAASPPFLRMPAVNIVIPVGLIASVVFVV